MDKYFSSLNNFLFSISKSDETLITNISGENSQFIRFNNSKVRQTGIIDDMNFSMTLLSNNINLSFFNYFTYFYIYYIIRQYLF